jgi:hypothetical protein
MAHTRPHFLHVGPGRTGTTWLYRMLRQHPDVHLNPVKEMRYFSEAHFYPEEGLVRRFRKGDSHNQDYRSYLRTRLGWYLKHPFSAAKSLDRLMWDCKFLFGSRSDDWFEGLFECEDSKITGDFSPQTQRLPREEVIRIAREWPATKVLLTVRDPIDWSWSFASKWLIPNVESGHVSDDQFRDFLSEFAPYFPTVSRISRWETAFAGRFKLLFFDDIAAHPVRVLNDVCNFLGLSTAPIISFNGVSERSYSSRPPAIPTRFRRMLIELYQDEVRALAETYGGYPRHWFEGYRDCARTVPSL